MKTGLTQAQAQGSFFFLFLVLALMLAFACVVVKTKHSISTYKFSTSAHSSEHLNKMADAVVDFDTYVDVRFQ